MVLFNHATREMTAKIVYYGPGLCGKTTNLLIVFDKLDPKNRGKMLSLATKTDRTLFFDLLPVDIGKVGAFNLKIQLYTVPGQVFYNETRKLVLKGADAVVFVADSQPSMIESNRESFDNLLENLEQNQINPNEIPIIVQFNKRDLPGALPVEDLQDQLGLEGYPYMEAAAIKGEGVMETFKLATKVTAKFLISKLQNKPLPPQRDPKAVKSSPREKPKEKEKKKVAKPPEPEPLEMTPFPESSGSPFPEAEAPFPQKDYERIEEVPLERLLDGRALPISSHADDEVEHLGTEHLIDSGAVALAIEDEPEPIPFTRPAPSASSDDVKALRAEVAELRRKNEELQSGIARIIAELNKLTRK